MTKSEIEYLACKQLDDIKYLYKEQIIGIIEGIHHKAQIPMEEYPVVRDAVFKAITVFFPQMTVERIKDLFNTFIEDSRIKNSYRISWFLEVEKLIGKQTKEKMV